MCAEYFEVGPNARYLATVGRVKPAHRETFAAATLAGDLVRVHTVDRDENPLYWKLLHAAGKATGLPVLYNTSLQPLRRAAGLHAARRRAQLLLFRNRLHVRRQFLPAKVRQASGLSLALVGQAVRLPAA